MLGFFKIMFGTAAGIELASYDMAYSAVRNLSQNRDRLAAQLTEVSPDSSQAEDLKYHLRRIDDELSRFAYYGIAPPARRVRYPKPDRALDDHLRRVMNDRERRIDQLIALDRAKQPGRARVGRFQSLWGRFRERF